LDLAGDCVACSVVNEGSVEVTASCTDDSVLPAARADSRPATRSTVSGRLKAWPTTPGTACRPSLVILRVASTGWRSMWALYVTK
jgi:hypothetical protein